MAFSCTHTSLSNTWICLFFVSLFASPFCLYITSVLWPCLVPLSLPFKQLLLPFIFHSVCLHACMYACMHVYPRFYMRSVGISESGQLPLSIILVHADVFLSSESYQDPFHLVWWCLQVFYPGAGLEWKYPGFGSLLSFSCLPSDRPISPNAAGGLDATHGPSASTCVACCGGEWMPLGFCFCCSGFYSVRVQGGFWKSPVL